ncbi:MAG: 4Fe-4S dicluster domain-containing protein [Chloroflexi bacterium]|nr:4Fe-4S dicluster domain-containing protein [Chloroflexota bacterium]
MNLVELLARLAEDDETLPRVDENRCLNARFRQRECTLCQDACPVEAISVFPGDSSLPHKVLVDADTCARCGLCVHVCPTGAFTVPDHARWQLRLHRTAQALGPVPVEFLCPLQEEKTTPAPVHARVQLDRCLASLSLADLIDLARGREGDVWLDDRPCTSCPLQKVWETMARVVEQANQLLEAWGQTARVRTHRRDGDLLGEEKALPVHRSGGISLSRRELFTSLSGHLVRAAFLLAEDLVPSIPSAPPSPRDIRLQQHLPRTRRHLTAALRRMGSPRQETLNLENLPWTVVQVGDSCTACGLCARFCPTGALRFYVTPPTNETKGSFTLTFIPPDCVDCGICLLACPEEAISYGQVIYTDWLITREEALVKEGEVVPCEDCGIPTTPGDPPLCFVCRSQREKSVYFRSRQRMGDKTSHE